MAIFDFLKNLLGFKECQIFQFQMALTLKIRLFLNCFLFFKKIIDKIIILRYFSKNVLS